MVEYSEGIVVYSYSELYESMKNLIQEWRILKTDSYKDMPFKFICRFTNDDDYTNAVELCIEMGNLWLVIEEVTHFVSVHQKSVPFDHVLRYGRHFGISLVLITQRCSEIPRLYTSQSDIVISFRQQEPRDIDYMSKIGIVGSEGAEKIARLPVFEYPKDKKKLIPALNDSLIIFQS
jgi:hypothetical protein